MNGFLHFLKPTGMTSHDCVAAIRKTLGEKKVGHTGTLDPMAAGVLPILVGSGTKFSQYLIEKDKAYRGILRLDVQTDTEDIYGNVLSQDAMPPLERDEIEAVLHTFLGKQRQIPPMYSALKIDGKKLYDVAREGKVVARKPREIEISSIELIRYEHPYITFDVTCSKGTYIRTLCVDIAEKLNRKGCLFFLLRTKVFSLTLSNAITLEDIFSLPERSPIQPIDSLLEYPDFQISTKEEWIQLKQTGYLRPDHRFSPNRLYKAYFKNDFVGILHCTTEKNSYHLKTRV